MNDQQPLILQIHQREGTVFITDGKEEHIALASIVIAAVPPPNSAPGCGLFRWAVNGDIVSAATALARFMIQNPPFADVVDGLREIFIHGNKIGGALPPDQLPPGVAPMPPGSMEDRG